MLRATVCMCVLSYVVSTGSWLSGSICPLREELLRPISDASSVAPPPRLPRDICDCLFWFALYPADDVTVDYEFPSYSSGLCDGDPCTEQTNPCDYSLVYEITNNRSTAITVYYRGSFWVINPGNSLSGGATPHVFACGSDENVDIWDASQPPVLIGRLELTCRQCGD